jgi:hypothetical protein
VTRYAFMRHAMLIFLIVALSRCCTAGEAKPDQTPLWYRDGGEQMSWSYRSNLAVGEAVYYLSVLSDDALLIRFVDHPNENISNRIALEFGNSNNPAVIAALENAWRRFPKNAQIARKFAKAAVKNWSCEQIRTLFWSLTKSDKYDEVYFAFYREMAKCGTEADAVRLIEQLPAGSNWQRDPVIGRIRLHRSEAPDKLAFEILEAWSLEEYMKDKTWSKYLYRQELLRYLTFGRDQRYRKHFQQHTREFRTDQETYPHGLEEMIEKWMQAK